MKQALSLHSFLGALALAGFGLLQSPATLRAEGAGQAWLRRHDPASTFSQGGEAVAFDRHGNVAVTGFTSAANGRKIYYVAKYAANDGTRLWSVELAGNQTQAVAHAIACDSAGNVIVTGSAAVGPGTDLDIYTVKLGALSGNVIWQAAYDGDGHADEGLCLALDGSDNVLVGGSTFITGAAENVCLIKYSAAGNSGTGAELWTRTVNYTGRRDVARAIAVDGQGNVAVAGVLTDAAGSKAFVARYKASDGSPLFEKFFPVTSDPTDCEATAVAVDKAGDIAVTGRIKAGSGYDVFTNKYSVATSSLAWSRTFHTAGTNTDEPAGVAIDGNGDVFLAATDVADTLPAVKRFFATKYAAGTGVTLWGQYSPAPDGLDRPRRIVVDLCGNVIVTGTSRQAGSHDDDYYTASYNGANGKLQWAQRFRGSLNGGGADTPLGLAVDRLGNVAVTGAASRANPAAGGPVLTEIATLKYQRLALVTGNPAPGAGEAGSGVPKGTVIASLGTPALSDSGALVAKVSINTGAATLGAIHYAGPGGTRLAAIQGRTAPGIAMARYGVFRNPVTTPDGSLAFYASLTGVPLSKAGAVFTDALGSGLEPVVQIGAGVPVTGFASSVLVKSVGSVAAKNGFVLTLLKLQGAGVNAANDTLLMGSLAAENRALLRTGQLLVGGDPNTAITKISVLQPAPRSAGQGRWQAAGTLMARATVADGRQFILKVASVGSVAQTLKSGDAVNGVSGAVWAAFGLPAISGNNFNIALAGKFAQGGTVTAANDGAVFFSLTGSTYGLIAREGADAPGTGAPAQQYKGFFDPVSNNQGKVAYVATLQGTGVTAANQTGLWWGSSGTMSLVARTGALAPDAAGQPGKAKFSALSALVLPDGSGSGPVFRASLAGSGIDSTNNSGLWAMGSDSRLREIVRTGGRIGALQIRRVTALGGASGAQGVGRNYDASGGLAALVVFTNGKQALVPLALP